MSDILYIIKNKISFFLTGILVFSFLLTGCGDKKDKKATGVSIEWKTGKPAGISIPLHMVAGFPPDSLKKSIQVRLAGNTNPVLGNFNLTDDAIVFEPLVSLSHGLQYEIWLNDKILEKISVPAANNNNRPAVVNIYPTADSLPENLLKIHIQFSKPMQEGESLKNVLLVRNSTDTLHDVFLELEPELWNKEKTILTVWFDPGRIKRDLQPNKKMGRPLHRGGNYELIIGLDLQDAEALSLGKNYTKKFFTISGDNVSPTVSSWDIQATPDSLVISFKEPLDFVLLTNAIHIKAQDSSEVQGVILTHAGERSIVFKPHMVMKPGNYLLEAESRLEDLAGNNLQRLFDTDIAARKDSALPKNMFRKAFVIYGRK